MGNLTTETRDCPKRNLLGQSTVLKVLLWFPIRHIWKFGNHANLFQSAAGRCGLLLLFVQYNFNSFYDLFQVRLLDDQGR